VDEPSPTQKFNEVNVYEKALTLYKFVKVKTCIFRIYTVWCVSSHLLRGKTNLIWFETTAGRIKLVYCSGEFIFPWDWLFHSQA